MNTQTRWNRPAASVLGLALLAASCADEVPLPWPWPVIPTPAPAERPAVPSLPREAILVVADGEQLTEGEQDLQDTLERGLTFDLLSIVDDDFDIRDLDPGVVILASSVDPDQLDKRWDNLRMPVLALSHTLFPELGMTGDGPNDHGLTDSARVQAAGDHPILRGVHTGELMGLTDANFGVPPDSATVVLRDGDRPGRALIFVYEPGDSMAAERPAPHRRVGFYQDTTQALEDSAAQETLLENAILWTWSGRVPR